MWTIYSERLFQTQGTWAYATVGGDEYALNRAELSESLKGLMVGAGRRGQEHLWELSCDVFGLC